MSRPNLTALEHRLRLPVISAPMLRVSNPDVVVESCRAGVVGAFPTANARTPDRLDEWLHEIEDRLEGGPAAPFCPNLIVRNPSMEQHLEKLVDHRVEMVITSTGSPAPVVDALHGVGALVLADVASLRHAERALEAGADGLVLLAAGPGDTRAG